MDATDIIEAIDASYESEQESPARRYIGASAIGNECDANIAFNLRGFPNVAPDPQLKRIFKMGHIIEDVVLADLKRVEKRLGIEVQAVDVKTGQQFTYKAFGGHISCHTDGIVVTNDSDMVLEIKSMNDSSFRSFVNRGVQRSHPHYFAQVQMYMGMSGRSDTLFIAYNKNRSVYHAEIVSFDEFEWASTKERINHIVRNEAAKIARDRSDWRCKGCFKRDACWGKAEVPVACTSCQHAKASNDGGWFCTRHRKNAESVCDQYQQYLPFDRA